MSEFTQAARSVPCDFCGAAKGEPCRTPRGRTTFNHSVRDYTVRAAFFFGYEAGLRDAVAQPNTAQRRLAFFAKKNAERSQA